MNPAPMVRRPFAALALFCVSALLVTQVRAQVATGEALASPHQVRAWLTRIHEAANSRNFQGTFVVSGSGSVASARIAHFCDGTSQFERIESLDGRARHVLRHNDVIQTVWPGKRLALVERYVLPVSFPALIRPGDDRITDSYDVYKQEIDRVAGHEAHVLWVKPRDALRFGYRLWSDKATGLLLRAEVLGERSEVIETSAFSDVQIGVKPQPELVLQAMKRLESSGYRIVRPVMMPTSLEGEGWAIRDVVPGFREVSCVKRPLDDVSAPADGSSGRLLQAIFSDGLTHVSVFVEPYNPARHTHSMVASVGATQTLMHQQGPWWITVVGDVPAATLRRFASGLVRMKPAGGDR